MKNLTIADGHNLCREALCDYIRHADQNIALQSYGDYAALCDAIAQNAPDVVLIDIDLPGFQKHDFLSRFCSGASNPIKVGFLISSRHGSTEDYHAAIYGVFPKYISCKEFLGGINDIFLGRKYFPAVSALYASHDDNGLPVQKDYGFTSREKEVLNFLVKGASNKDIARALDLQVVTVKLHVRGICRKMHASNRTQAALIAKENGWG